RGRVRVPRLGRGGRTADGPVRGAGEGCDRPAGRARRRRVRPPRGRPGRWRHPDGRGARVTGRHRPAPGGHAPGDGRTAGTGGAAVTGEPAGGRGTVRLALWTAGLLATGRLLLAAGDVSPGPPLRS